MRRVMPILIGIAVSTSGGSETRAGEADAGALAADIDRLIDSRLAAEKVAPASPTDDAEFLRRVYLDLHGTVPTAEQTRGFLNDSDPRRREMLIESLLASPRYGDYLADIWESYLVSPLADQRLKPEAFREWLADRFNKTTWDRFATELITATGKIDENPAVTYLVEGRLPRTVPDLTDLTSRYFLGIRLNCAQCHDHPFVNWKQEEFWGMAAFWTQVQTPGKPKLIYQVGVKDYPEITLASLKAEATDGFQPRPPTFLGGEAWQGGKTATNRGALAAWMTSPKNPYFARAIVNRTWWRLFGRGIVNPVDDMHEANPPSHPELLDLLARQFVESGFDLKFLTRAIVSSRAYQRTSRPSGDDADKQAALFGRMSVKVLSAGQLYDSLVAVLGAPVRNRGGAGQTPRAEFVQFFSDDGDPNPTAYRRGIPHLLRQMNSDQFAGRNLGSLASRAAAPGRSPDDVAADLFLAILTRRPTAEEQRLFREHSAKAGSLDAAARELAWALLMTSEFSLNH